MSDSEEQSQSVAQENEGGEKSPVTEADQNQSAEADQNQSAEADENQSAEAGDNADTGIEEEATDQEQENATQEEENPSQETAGEQQEEVANEQEEDTAADDEPQPDGEDRPDGAHIDQEDQQNTDGDGQVQNEEEQESQEAAQEEAQEEEAEQGVQEEEQIAPEEVGQDQEKNEDLEEQEEAQQDAREDVEGEEDSEAQNGAERSEEVTQEGEQAAVEEQMNNDDGGGDQSAAGEEEDVAGEQTSEQEEVQQQDNDVTEQEEEQQQGEEQIEDDVSQQQGEEQTEDDGQQQETEQADGEEAQADDAQKEDTEQESADVDQEEGAETQDMTAEGETDQAPATDQASEADTQEEPQAAEDDDAQETAQAADGQAEEPEESAQEAGDEVPAEEAAEETAQAAAEEAPVGETDGELAEEQAAQEEQQEPTAVDSPQDVAQGETTQAAGDVETQEEKVEAEETQMSKEQADVNENANEAVGSGQEEGTPPPPPHLPSPERTHTSIEGQMSTSALNVVWSFGLNRNVPVLNLSDGVRQAIMYPCAHVGIMYDFKNNKQHILQAHLNPITCTAASQDKRWLVTGDVGPDAMVNIWDTYTGIPIQTMFDPNPSGGVVAVALTPDSRFLATLSALPVQTLAIWDWTVDGDVPVCSADLKPDFGLQNFICFDPTDIHHVVTNSETQVLFYHWEDNLMKYFAPPLSDNDFNKPVGRYSQSMFQKGIARALTATSIGNLVVWDNNRPLSKFMDVNQSADKKPLKIIRIHDKGINVLTTTDNYIVVGDTAGHVKFFDQGLRLIYWYQDFHVGPCTAVSFAHMPDFVPIPDEGHRYPSDATKHAKPFVIRNFVVGTAIAVYGNINTDGSKFKVIHREHDAAVHALAAHPTQPIIAMGSYSGLLKLWNYRTKEVVASRMFEKAHIHCCTFDPKGFYIVVGCANGALYIVDSVALLDQINEPFRYAQDCITHIAFSHNSTFFATADAGFAITVFKRLRKEGKYPYVWHGRYRSHYKPIKDLTFGVDPDTNKPKLMSLGEDRMLIEYDLHYVGKTNNHMVPCAQDRIEQSALPTCMTSYPPITKESFILTANDQFKLKCYNSTTKMCRKTVLGPTYGSPIKKMMVVPTTEEDDTKNRFLAYITDEKIGLHILPATGNPHLAMALIAHPSGISNMTCSFDGAYLFTAGGPDYAVHMWEINIKALQAQAKLGGEDLIPFYGLLDGGRDGEMFAELEDLFYYAQLRHQGINSTETRQIGNKIPITEVPYVMRAMGYYPSEQEIEDMLNEIKYEEFVNSGRYQEEIDLGSFIRLYVNHRPAFGLSTDKLLWAFKTLAESPELGKGGIIERGDLLEILQKKGEHMTEFELAEHLTTLMGFNQEGGSCEQEPFEADKAGQFIAENLPYDINAEILINEILGFSLTEDLPAADDTKDVYKYTEL